MYAVNAWPVRCHPGPAPPDSMLAISPGPPVTN
jgi:hypothetical protein